MLKLHFLPLLRILLSERLYNHSHQLILSPPILKQARAFLQHRQHGGPRQEDRLNGRERHHIRRAHPAIKQPDLAKPLLEGLVALDPYDLWPLTALASINLDSKNLPLALTLLNRAVDVANADVTARALRAEVRHHLGDHEGALADLSLLLEKEMAPAAQRARAVVVGAPARKPTASRP